jgi:hypothetical protein
MKKVIVFLSLILLFTLSFTTSIADSSKMNNATSNDETSSRPIFIIGSITKPVIENDTINANALQVFYYQSGFLVDNFGIITGLKPIQIEKTPLFYMNSPGPFGYICYIIGLCTDVQILN